jgi:hypothetical protein
MSLHGALGLLLALGGGATPAPPQGLAPAAAAVRGVVRDGLTGEKVPGASVTLSCGLEFERKARADREGRFALDGLPARKCSLAVKHGEYEAASGVIELATAATRIVDISLLPSTVAVGVVEIPVEVEEEDLRSYLLNLPKFPFTKGFKAGHLGTTLRGTYRVCVASSGEVARVDALEAAGDADPVVRKAILETWRYRPLPHPACFTWRVVLRFGDQTHRAREQLLPAMPWRPAAP